MSASINGTTGVTYPDSSTQASSQVGMKNRIIDGGFIINQRGYVTNTALSASAYAHDRWKAGSGGCTYTFTQGSLGVNTTITITAGTLVQVIEGCNLAEGGTYVLSWTGTAQGRLNGGTYGASGSVVITGWTAGTNLNVEFNTGTLGSVQLEKGSTATSFDYRPYGTELALCQRYYQRIQPNLQSSGFLCGVAYTTTAALCATVFPVVMRAGPTLTYSANGDFLVVGNGNTYTPTAIGVTAAGPANTRVDITTSGLTAGNGVIFQVGNTATAWFAYSAEL